VGSSCRARGAAGATRSRIRMSLARPWGCGSPRALAWRLRGWWAGAGRAGRRTHGAHRSRSPIAPHGFHRSALPHRRCVPHHAPGAVSRGALARVTSTVTVTVTVTVTSTSTSTRTGHEYEYEYENEYEYEFTRPRRWSGEGLGMGAERSDAEGVAGSPAGVMARSILALICACTYVLCMPYKTISVDLEAYEHLRRLRRDPSESFSKVIRRLGEGMVDGASSGEGLVESLFSEAGSLWLPSEAELDRLDQIQAAPRPRRDRRREAAE